MTEHLPYCYLPPKLAAAAVVAAALVVGTEVVDQLPEWFDYCFPLVQHLELHPQALCVAVDATTPGPKFPR